jgi:inosine-uridine nucleoside N-ribohydrolase
MAGAAKIPVIMDVDTGVDDAVAIALATRLPELDLIGVTTVAGNVDVEKTTENSLRVLAALGCSSTPVYRGMSRPLARAFHDASEFHGASGLGDAEFPPSPVHGQAETAPEFIVRTVRERPGEITLIPVAPLTNIAVALALEPELPRLVKRVVIMGGAFLCPGNASPYAEYNIWADPEAAAIVANSELPITYIGLDVTHRAPLPKSLWTTLAERDGVEAKMVYALSRRTFTGRGKNEFHLHDPLAVAVAACPGLVTTEAWGVTVETGIGDQIGRTCLVKQPDAPPHQVAVAVQTDEFLVRFSQALSLG